MNPIRHCGYVTGCPGKVTHRIFTKLGDFYVCNKHAKMAIFDKEVRYMDKIRKRRNPPVDCPKCGSMMDYQPSICVCTSCGFKIRMPEEARTVVVRGGRGFTLNPGVLFPPLSKNPKKGGTIMAKRKRKYTRRMRVFGLPIIPLAIVGGLIWYFAKRV